MAQPDAPVTGTKPFARVPVRIGGKLISFRLEEGNLEDIDRLARAQGMDRSKWIRSAIHAQLVQELIAEKDGFAPVPAVQPSEPPPPPGPNDRANRWA